MSDDEGEMFFMEYWQFEHGEDDQSMDDQGDQVLKKRSMPSLQSTPILAGLHSLLELSSPITPKEVSNAPPAPRPVPQSIGPTAAAQRARRARSSPILDWATWAAADKA
ncbi:MAG: hypothetical protein LQ347_004809 [Umbilicaria vellea]|nr:MAG: hypothetical protein LQ347_004809 [Umbilicaria vellea]